MQHADEFSRRLPHVQRDHDQPFGHHREVRRGPVDAVRSDQRARSPGFKPARAKNCRACCTSVRNSPPVARYELAVTHFLYDGVDSPAYRAARKSARGTSSRERSAVRFQQLAKHGLSGGKYSSQSSTPVRTGNSGYCRATCCSKYVPIRAIICRFRATVLAHRLANLFGFSVERLEGDARSYPPGPVRPPSSAGDSCPRSRIRLRMRSSIVMPADGTPPGIDVTIAWKRDESMRSHARRMLTSWYMSNLSDENTGAPPSFRRHPLACVAVQHLHRHQHRKHRARLAVSLYAAGHRRKIFFVSRVHVAPERWK